MTELCIVIPSLNPEEHLIDFLRTLRRLCECSILVVNDGSRKECAGIFSRVSEMEGISVLTHPANRGKGRALKTAFQFILKHRPGTTGVITADADGQHRPEDVAACIRALEREPECLILGCRNFTGKGIPWRCRFGNRVTVRVFHWLTGVHCSDTQTGLRGIPASFLPRLLNCPGERFEYETGMLLEAVRSVPRIAVREIPIAAVYENGRGKTHFRPFTDSFRIYGMLFRSAFFRTEHS